MNTIESIEQAINQRDVRAIIAIMFESNTPVLKKGFRTETDLWDFKKDCPRSGKDNINAWAEFSKDVLGFYNNKGGVIFFGINDENYEFCGATYRLDNKMLNDQLRKFLSDRIWVEYYREFIQANQRYLGIALIPQRGPVFEKFRRDAPIINNKQLFQKDFSAIREHDSIIILNKTDTELMERKNATPTIGKIYEINETFFRILCPDYTQFIMRPEYCQIIESTLRESRTAIAAITGIGGVGKTALATWTALKAYDQGDFKFIVSLTAKDRELTDAGIIALKPVLTSYETLLDTIFETLGFPDYKERAIQEKEKSARDLIQNSDGLLYIDNLETVDDKRIINFLDNLPTGVHAITTSRRTTVRVSTRPIDLGPFTDAEVVNYVRSLSALTSFGYINEFSKKDCVRIGTACDRIPLIIRWALSRSKNAAAVLEKTSNIAKSGRRGEELLEFCFRRVFDSMPQGEKALLHVLSLFHGPLSMEAILIGAGVTSTEFLIHAESLIDDSLIQRLFDPDLNDYTYTLLPLTRYFVYSEVAKQQSLEHGIRKKMRDYFEAADVKDKEERLIIRELRQGSSRPDAALIDLALAAQRRGDFESAQRLYEQAYSRNPKSWRAAKAYADFLRHCLKEQAKALQYYEIAVNNAPKRGYDRGIILRERGILLKDSGLPNATDLSIESLENALGELPNDPIAKCILGRMYDRKGQYGLVISLLEPLIDHQNPKTRRIVLQLLLTAFKRTEESAKVTIIDEKLRMMPEESNE